jgi:hypothetical protein
MFDDPIASLRIVCELLHQGTQRLLQLLPCRLMPDPRGFHPRPYLVKGYQCQVFADPIPFL